MIKKIKYNADPATTLSTLRSDGVFIVEDYIKGSPLDSLRKEVSELCNNGNDYGFGKTWRLEGAALLSCKHKLPNTFNAFCDEWLFNLNRNYKNQNFCQDVFATHDYIPTSSEALETAPNGWLHSDKKNCLKFFIYLTDIDETSGAFYCSPGSISTGYDLRQKMLKENNYSEKRRLEIEFPELVKEYPPEPVNGKAGTMIVFDTDTFHMGGKVEKGRSRLVVRAHCF